MSERVVVSSSALFSLQAREVTWVQSNNLCPAHTISSTFFFSRRFRPLILRFLLHCLVEQYPYTSHQNSLSSKSMASAAPEITVTERPAIPRSNSDSEVPGYNTTPLLAAPQRPPNTRRTSKKSESSAVTPIPKGKEYEAPDASRTAVLIV